MSANKLGMLKKGALCTQLAFILCLALFLQQVAWAVSASADTLDEPGGQTAAPFGSPAITFVGEPIYNEMVIPEDSQLMVHYEFEVYSNETFSGRAVTLPEPLIADHTGGVSVSVRDHLGQPVDVGSLYIDADGNIYFNLDFTPDTPSSTPEAEAEQEPEPETEQEPETETEQDPETEPEAEQEPGSEPETEPETEPESANPEYISDTEETEQSREAPAEGLNETPRTLLMVSNSEPVLHTPHTVSFAVPAVFDLDKIPPAEEGALRQVTLVSDGEPVTLTLIVALGIMPLSGPSLPDWNLPSGSAYRPPAVFPLGIVHDFGALVFHDLVVDVGTGSGYFHSEGGVMVGGDLTLEGRATVDFGGAHNDVGIQTHPETDLRLILGGGFSAEYASNEDPTNWNGSHAAAVYLHFGDMIMGTDAVANHIHSRGYVEVSDIVAPPLGVKRYGGDNPVPDGNGEYFFESWGGVPTAPDADVAAFFNSAWDYTTRLSSHFASLGVPSATRPSNVHLAEYSPPIAGQSVPRIQPPTGVDPDSTIIYNLEFDQTVNVSGQNFDLYIFPDIHFPDWFSGNFIINVANTGNPIAFPSDTIISDPTGSIYGGDLVMIYRKVQLYSGRIIWNFSGSAPLSSNYELIVGAVLAPRAHFHAAGGGSVNGELIVGALSHVGGGFEQHTTSRLQQGIPGAPWPIVPPPPIGPLPPPEPPPTPPSITPPPRPEPPIPPIRPPIIPPPPPVDPPGPGGGGGRDRPPRPPLTPLPPISITTPPIEEEILATEPDEDVAGAVHNPSTGGFHLRGNANIAGLGSLVLIFGTAFGVIRYLLRKKKFS
ncbi:MAG: choice-of-anchor A family protein [Oscillospiraceae bacterium]|nr:choice-of-anchor A family protein [Oscillospiraceae bacterium]